MNPFIPLTKEEYPDPIKKILIAKELKRKKEGKEVKKKN